MLNYFYDKESDIFYFSQGAPNAKDETIETGGDVILRIDPRTKSVRGFTLLNASRRTHGTKQSAPLPFNLQMALA